MEENNQRTSRFLLVVGFLVVLISLSVITPSKWFGVNQKKPIYQKLDLTVVTSPSSIAEDKNNDGKITWGEIVTETFKDSTSSLVKINQKPIDQKIIDELNDPNNLTSSFSKNVYLATAYLKKNGITDENEKQKAVNELMLQEAVKIIPTIYTTENIHIAKTETRESIKKYGNEISPIIKDLISSKIITTDLVGISNYVSTKDEKSLLPLIDNKNRLDVVLQKLLKLEVPISATTYHILLLNRVALYRDTVDNLSKANSDPVRSTLSVDNYQKAIILLLRSPNQFFEYFSIQNIVFLSKDAGYIFTSGYTYK